MGAAGANVKADGAVATLLPRTHVPQPRHDLDPLACQEQGLLAMCTGVGDEKDLLFRVAVQPPQAVRNHNHRFRRTPPSANPSPLWPIGDPVCHVYLMHRRRRQTDSTPELVQEEREVISQSLVKGELTIRRQRLLVDLLVAVMRFLASTALRHGLRNSTCWLLRSQPRQGHRCASSDA